MFLWCFNCTRMTVFWPNGCQPGHQATPPSLPSKSVCFSLFNGSGLCHSNCVLWTLLLLFHVPSVDVYLSTHVFFNNEVATSKPKTTLSFPKKKAAPGWDSNLRHHTLQSGTVPLIYTPGCVWCINIVVWLIAQCGRCQAIVRFGQYWECCECPVDVKTLLCSDCVNRYNINTLKPLE